MVRKSHDSVWPFDLSAVSKLAVAPLKFRNEHVGFRHVASSCCHKQEVYDPVRVGGARGGVNESSCWRWVLGYSDWENIIGSIVKRRSQT